MPVDGKQLLQCIITCVCSCLFAREHNISGDEESSDHAKPRQNRRVQFSYSATTSTNRYLERLEQYFVANSIPADSAGSHKGRAILISVISPKAYNVLSDLCSPTPPSKKTYAELTTILKNYFAPKKLVIAEDTGSIIVHNAKARVSQHSLLT